jgi:RNA polymerase sigma factor (sigma-70 family)
MTSSRTDSILLHLRKAVLQRDGAGMTDGQLLENFVTNRDAAAFEALVRRHGRMVQGVCLRVLRNPHDAEDAFQATFLVLAHKAARVFPREMVGNWLYGVAHTTALRARAAAAKRRLREKQVLDVPETEQADSAQRDDLQPLLDQELTRLPDKYRLPIILCDLEGRARREVARQLKIPEGTLSSRLTTARRLLAKRLSRKGVTISGGAVAMLLTKNAAACVPATLIRATVKAVSQVAAGQTGLISAPIFALKEGVLKAMFISKLKTVAAVVVILGAIGFGGGLATQRTGAQQISQRQERPSTQHEQEQSHNTTRDGRAFRGAGEELRVDATPDLPTRQQVLTPPKVAQPREYPITSRLMEAGADQPKEVLRLPRITLDEGQPGRLAIVDGPQNLLEKVIVDEKIKIGTFLNVRVKRLGKKKVRLILSFEKNELEKSSVSEIHVLGNNVQAIQDVELRKPVRMVFQKDARGSAQRWVEITVDEIAVEEQIAPPASNVKTGN